MLIVICCRIQTSIFEKMSTLYRFINPDGSQVIAGLNGNPFFPNGLLKMTMLKIADQIPNFMQVMENFNLMSVRIIFFVFLFIHCLFFDNLDKFIIQYENFRRLFKTQVFFSFKTKLLNIWGLTASYVNHVLTRSEFWMHRRRSFCVFCLSLQIFRLHQTTSKEAAFLQIISRFVFFGSFAFLKMFHYSCFLNRLKLKGYLLFFRTCITRTSFDNIFARGQ